MNEAMVIVINRGISVARVGSAFAVLWNTTTCVLKDNLVAALKAVRVCFPVTLLPASRLTIERSPDPF
jgi:hypothetical protein